MMCRMSRSNARGVRVIAPCACFAVWALSGAAAGCSSGAEVAAECTPGEVESCLHATSGRSRAQAGARACSRPGSAGSWPGPATRSRSSGPRSRAGRGTRVGVGGRAPRRGGHREEGQRARERPSSHPGPAQQVSCRFLQAEAVAERRARLARCGTPRDRAIGSRARRTPRTEAAARSTSPGRSRGGDPARLRGARAVQGGRRHLRVGRRLLRRVPSAGERSLVRSAGRYRCLLQLGRLADPISKCLGRVQQPRPFDIRAVRRHDFHVDDDLLSRSANTEDPLLI